MDQIEQGYLRAEYSGLYAYGLVKYPEALPLIEEAYAEAQKASSYEMGLAILKDMRRLVGRLAEAAQG